MKISKRKSLKSVVRMVVVGGLVATGFMSLAKSASCQGPCGECYIPSPVGPIPGYISGGLCTRCPFGYSPETEPNVFANSPSEQDESSQLLLEAGE